MPSILSYNPVQDPQATKKIKLKKADLENTTSSPLNDTIFKKQYKSPKQYSLWCSLPYRKRVCGSPSGSISSHPLTQPGS